MVPLYCHREIRAVAKTTGVLVLFLLAAFAGCASSGVAKKTRALNEEQIDALQKMQEQQVKILAFVESLEPVDHADVHVGGDGVVVIMYFKPGKMLTLEQRDKTNEFITRETGISKQNIKLMVKKHKGN